MAKLTTKQRKALPRADFGVPSKAPGPGSYPMPDRGHAQNAEERATQAVNKGRMKPAQRAAIFAKAKRIEGKTAKPSTAAKPSAAATRMHKAASTPFSELLKAKKHGGK